MLYNEKTYFFLLQMIENLIYTFKVKGSEFINFPKDIGIFYPDVW